MTARYDALGLRFSVRTETAQAESYVRESLAGLETSAPAESTDSVLSLDPGAATLAAAVAGLVGNVNLRAIEAATGNLLVHAGAVVDRDGRAVVVCAPSGSGKSTLTAVLAARGHAYVTDETVCIDPLSLRITPFRKPVAVKRGSQEVLPHLRPRTATTDASDGSESWLVPPSALGGVDLPTRPLLPVAIVFPTFASGVELYTEPLSEAQAAYTLGSNASSLWAVQGGPLPALARVARRCPAIRLVHGEVHAAADAVESFWSAA